MWQKVGENIFVIKDKVLYAQELTSCLDGITRKTIIQLAEERGYTVRESVSVTKSTWRQFLPSTAPK